MVTLAPLTTMPLAAVLVVQPTVPPLPWSARHSHRSSPMTLLLLTTSVWVARPTVAPPMRAKTSDRTVGSAAWLALEPGAGGVGPAGVEGPPADADAVDVGGGQDRVAAVGHQGGDAQAEHDGVGVGDVDGAVDLVDAGGEQQVLPARERGVDLRDGAAR